eukprot:TRINITY_DN4891_c0_g1_i1.p1 TRINITY_DN4891_c0_g1~~TRINITY_DN4891_c0_g1_i1.p1  ORF type:complete len:107 (-),score=27.61 TRINITY_DN4891_c0_g1_i1:213-533(-)
MSESPTTKTKTEPPKKKQKRNVIVAGWKDNNAFGSEPRLKQNHEKLKKWVEFGEFITVKFDLDNDTAVVVPVAESEKEFKKMQQANPEITDEEETEQTGDNEDGND